jgi:hypothetical protein
MKDIILKSGTYLKETKTQNTKNIPGQSMEDFVVGVLANPTCCVKSISLSKGTVTQSTNRTTAVTLNSSAGVITTASATIPVSSNVAFTVNNSYVKADSVILLTINTDGLTAYSVHLSVESVAAGSFVIRTFNANGAVAIGAIKINYVIL